MQSESFPVITGGTFCNEMEKKLIALPPKLGGLGILIFTEISNDEFQNFIKLTECLSTKIINQMLQYEPDEEIKNIKNIIHAARVEQNKQKLDVIPLHMNSEQLHTNDLNQETVASAWLITLPLKQEGDALTKQLFWDLIRIRYRWQLSRTPEFCKCGIRFSLQHALSCKNGGFISIRHNSIRDVTAKLLHEVCREVQLEPPLQPLTGEELYERLAITTNEARCNVSARGFFVCWSSGIFRCKGIQPKSKPEPMCEPEPQENLRNQQERKEKGI